MTTRPTIGQNPWGAQFNAWLDEQLAAAQGGSGHVIEEEGAPLPARTSLNFTGDSVVASDDSIADETAVVINHKADAVHSVGQPAAAHGLTDGTKHTATGLTVGQFLRATSATAFAFSDPDYGTTTELADVSGGTESAGTSTKLSRADHVHFHGDLSATLPNAHHNQFHPDSDHTGPTRHDVAIGGSLVGTRVRTNFVDGDAIKMSGVDVATGAGQVDITLNTVPQVVTLNALGGTAAAVAAELYETIQGGTTSSSVRRTKVELNNGTSWRMTAFNIVANATGAKFALQWSLDAATWRFLDNTLSVALGVVQSPTPASTAYISMASVALGVTTWVAIPAAAKTDVFLRVAMFDGAATTTGNIGLTTLQVK